MEDWAIERLREFVGRSDRAGLARRLDHGFAHQSMGASTSYRVDRNLPSLGRGLIVTREGVIPDYARVRRVFHLTNAIVKYYYSPFFAEELVPGFHARIAWLGERMIGFTRDGRYCAFMTDRAADFIPEQLFRDHPRLVACLTVGGSGPYADAAVVNGSEDVVCWGTDLLEIGIREPLAPADRYELFDSYGVESVPHVGPFEAADLTGLERWMRDLDERGARGVVLKPSERHHRPLKYTLPSAVERSASPWLSFDQQDVDDPFFERLAQAACAAAELHAPDTPFDWAAVGEAILAPLAGAAQHVASGSTLTQRCSVWLHDKEAAARLLEQLAEREPSNALEELALEQEDDGWRLRFERRFAEATATLQRRLSGASYRD